MTRPEGSVRKSLESVAVQRSIPWSDEGKIFMDRAAWHKEPVWDGASRGAAMNE